MPTIHMQNRRRRSRSASSAFSISSSSPRTARKVAVKRSYPEATPAQWSELSQWDADSARRGKYQRRGLSAGSDGFYPSRIWESQGAPQVAFRPPRTTFSASSDDFGLPIYQGETRDRVLRSTAASSSSLMDVSDTVNHDDLRRLRSNAFSELGRSIEESGEALIQRMREHENQRSLKGDLGWPLRPHVCPIGTNSPTQTYPSWSDIHGDEDEDDIQIYAGELVSRSNSNSQDVAMDGYYDSPTSGPTNHSFSSSPRSFGILSAEEEPPHFYSLPLNSSPQTSPMPESIPGLPASSHLSMGLPHSAPPDLYSRPSPQFHASEKDIDALAIALANVGSLNDYAALHQEDVGNDDNCHIGDLWR